MADAAKPPGLDDTDPVIECPKCGSRMEKVYVDALIADRCTICGGLWLDATEKDRLLTNPAAVECLDSGPFEPARVMDKVTQVRCPRDDTPLVHESDEKHPRIGVERCPLCGGICLDAGELRGLNHTTIFERLKSIIGK